MTWYNPLTWFEKEGYGSKLEKKASRGVSASKYIGKGYLPGGEFDNVPSGPSSEPSSEYDGPHAPGQDW